MKRADDLQRLVSGRGRIRQIPGTLRNARALFRTLRAPLSEVLDQYFDDPMLRAVFGGPGGDIGLPPGKAGALVSILVLNHFLGGGYYPIGGSGAMRDVYVSELKSHGAELKRNQLVERIDALGSNHFAVTTTKGLRFEARSIVSNVDATHTAEMLHGARPSFLVRRKVKKLRPSLGSFCLFIGTDLDLAKAGITDANIWHYGSHDLDGGYAPAFEGRFTEKPFFFLTAPTLKDPETKRAPEDHHTIELITFVPSAPFKPWFDKPTMKRGPAYEARSNTCRACATTPWSRKRRPRPPSGTSSVDATAASTGRSTARTKPACDASRPTSAYRGCTWPAPAYTARASSPAWSAGSSRHARRRSTSGRSGPACSPAPGASSAPPPEPPKSFAAHALGLSLLSKLASATPDAARAEGRGMSQPHTLVHWIEDWANKTPDSEAIFGKHGDHWHAWTWSQYWSSLRQVGKGLIALGHQVGECVAIVGNNRPEWVICEFGIMAARGIPAPIYVTNTDEQTAFIVDHCRAKIAFCDDRDQLTKYLRCMDAGMMSVEQIIVMDDLESDDERVMTLDTLLALGQKQDDAELDRRLAELTDTETALLIYTSGTTGTPKAVQLDHGGMITVADGILSRYEHMRHPEMYRNVSYLPLCHIAEQLFTNFFHILSGGRVYFCPDLKQIKDYLVDVRPTLMLGVPRVWEKFQAVLEARFGEATGLRGWLADWARRTELDAFKREVETGRPVNTLGRRLANQLVLSKIKRALGLDNLVVAATGAAPISVSTLEFFASLGFTLYEGYGMSETTGVAFLSAYGKPRFGTVGYALPGVEVRVGDDDEILLKGRIMTRGYLHQPEQTQKLIDEEGWMHTGDVGTLDDDGCLRITGRKKDLLITAGGKNVAPIELESHLKRIPGVGQAVVVGDRKPYLSALLTVDPEALAQVGEMLGIGAQSVDEVAKSDKFETYLRARVEEDCNAQVARYQTIKKFKVLPVEFSVDSGELTPTMKLKRNVVSKKYADEIEALYEN
ncbi:MAG: AMP-binding protein [Deltaproteobacteria bacterium]|nr:AMP-binding protein [Deltaproteobacteria bacterium]